MKIILKPIYELITGQYVLFDNIIYNYIAMFIIGLIAFNMAWNIVNKLYKDNYIHGKELGSIIHWVVRLIVFVITFYIFVAAMYIINNIKTVLIIIGLIIVVIVCYKTYNKKRKYKQYLEEGLYALLNELSSNMQIENKNLLIELNEKKIGNSGVVFEFGNNIINKSIKNSIKKIEELFYKSTIEFNTVLNKKENYYFIDKIQQNINNIMNKYYEQMEKQHKEIINEGTKQQLSLWKTSLKQDVTEEINNIFKKINLRNSGKRIEKMVLIGIILSIISVIEGAISIYIALK